MRRSLGLGCALALVVLAGPPVVATGAADRTGGASMAAAAGVSVWTESAYESVFRESGPSAQAGRAVALDTGRSEYEAGQVVLRSAQAFTVSGVTFTGLAGPGGSIPASELSYNFVDYEYLDHNSVFGGNQDVNPTVRTAPGWFPDRLLNDTSKSVDANTTQSIWVRVHVPESAGAGIYGGAVTVRTTAGNYTVPIRVDVRNVVLPSPDKSEFTNPMWQNILGFTSWDRGAGDTIEITYKYKRYSAQWWQFIDNWSEITKRYRNNNVQVPLLTLLLEGGTTVDAAGNYTFNWSKVDEVIDRIRSHGGVKRLEGFAMSGPHGEASPWYDASLPKGTWMSELIMRDSAGALVHGWKKWDDAASDNWRSQFIPALRAHVAAKGWTNMWWQHVGDEPNTSLGQDGWMGVAARIRALWPEVKLGDAIFHEPVATEVAKKADIMVPNLLNYFWNPKTYDDLRAQGKELWFYNCNIPSGNFLNRFVDQPQWHQRLTMWFAYSRNATGYLHWAYNNWQFKMSAQDLKGDGFIVRPDVPRNTLELSPRYESLRDGIEDWEVLNVLGKTNPGLARDLARSMAPSGEKYSADTAYMQRLRRIALDAAGGKPVIAKDLARGKTATASGQSTGNEAANAIDGNTATGWQPATGTGTQWLQVDLGRQIQLDGLRLHWGGTFGKSYKVLQSYNGTNWAPTFATSSGDGGDDFVGTNGKARYLRIEVTTGSAGDTPYRLTDVEVAGYQLIQQNLAGGRSYRAEPVPPGPRFLDPSGREATDGVLADDWGDDLAFGYELSQTGRNRVDAAVTVDLGWSQTVAQARAHVYQEYAYYRPDLVTVAVSNDNVNFTKVGEHGYANTAKDIWYDVHFAPVKARWVRLTYTKSWAPKATGVFVDDIEVYGVGQVAGQDEVPGSSAYQWGDQQHAFAPSATGSLQHWWWIPGQGVQNGDWAGGPIAGKPSGFVFDSQQHAVARGTSGTLKHWWWVPGESQVHVADWGGDAGSDPAAVVWGGQQVIVARSADGGLTHWNWDSLDGRLRIESWPRAPVPITGAPSAFTWRDQLHVVARGSDNKLYHWWWIANEPEPQLADWGGEVHSDPTSFVWNGQQHVFAKAADGVNLFHWWWDEGEGLQSVKWSGAPAGFVGNPVGYKFGAQQHVVARGPANTLYHWWWDQATGQVRFSDWFGQVYSDPIAFVYDGRQQHIFAQSATNTLSHWWWDGNLFRDDWGGSVNYPTSV